MANPVNPRYELEREPFGFGDLLTEWKSLLFSRGAFYVAWVLLTLFLAGGWLAERMGREFNSVWFPREAQTTLYQGTDVELNCSTYRKPGLFGRQFFIVWRRAAGEREWEPLLTVETSQDSPAWIPTVHQTPEGLQITDEKRNYVFDVATKKVVELNDFCEVYPGMFRSCLDPPLR